MIGRRYAKALVEAADGELEKVKADMEVLSKLKEVLKPLTRNPTYTRADKERIISEIAKGFSETTKSFLKLVARKGRLEYLEEIIEEFFRACAEKKGELEVEVISAETLSGSKLEALKEAVERKTGLKANLKVVVDRRVIGGLMVKTPRWVIDASVKGKLELLKDELKERG